MSDDCLDTDSLASVGEALAWRVPERLDHLAACGTCRGELLALAGLRAELLDVPRADALGVAPAPEAAPWTRARSTAPLRPGSTAPTRLAGVLAAGATFLIAAATLALVMGFLGA